MAEQLHLWGDNKDQAPVEYPTPAEPPPEPPPEPTTLDRDLELLYLDYLGQSAQRITVATELSQKDRREEYLRKINYEVAVRRLTAEQRDVLSDIVRGRRRYS